MGSPLGERSEKPRSDPVVTGTMRTALPPQGRHASIRAGRVAVSLLVVGACGGEPTPRAFVPAPPPAEREASPSEISDTNWQSVTSLRQSLELPLPVRNDWAVDDREPWLVARHRATHSELRARTWTAPRLVQPADCEAQLRLWRPSLPPTGADTAAVRRPLDAPEGFRGSIVAGVVEDASGLQGYALAIGSTIGRCYAALFTTHAAGGGSEQAIGRRLAIIVDGVLSRVRTRSVEDRALDSRPPHP